MGKAHLVYATGDSLSLRHAPVKVHTPLLNILAHLKSAKGGGGQASGLESAYPVLVPQLGKVVVVRQLNS